MMATCVQLGFRSHIQGAKTALKFFEAGFFIFATLFRPRFAKASEGKEKVQALHSLFEGRGRVDFFVHGWSARVAEKVDVDSFAAGAA